MSKAYCLPDSRFKRNINSILKNAKVVSQLSPQNLADAVFGDNRFIGREGTRKQLVVLDIGLVEGDGWRAVIDQKGNAKIIYPHSLDLDDFELDSLELEHELGHLCYWTMMNYLGKLRLKGRNSFEEKYAWDFAGYVRVDRHIP